MYSEDHYTYWFGKVQISMLVVVVLPWGRESLDNKFTVHCDSFEIMTLDIVERRKKILVAQ